MADQNDILPPAAQLLGRNVLSHDRETETTVIAFFARPEFTNRHGTVQGGLVGAMLDSATAVALYQVLPDGFTALTRRLDTRLLKPAPLGPLTVTARVVSRDDRDAIVEGEVAAPDGTIVARATAELRIIKR